MGTQLYMGVEGGLYPGHSNFRPPYHDQDLFRVSRFVRLNTLGEPDTVNGKFVFISIGNSAANLEFADFIPDALASLQKNPYLTLLNCAQTGKNADEINNPEDEYWRHVDNALTDAGMSPLQVQAIWLKESIPNDPSVWPAVATVFRDDVREILQIIKSRMPNIKAVYITSRIYGGYGPTGTSPEPFAYQYGFGVKWLIEEQLSGDPSLNFDPAKGPAIAPWISWGPYLWADGLNPRSDGLIWECNDFQNDGRHVNSKGKDKVSAKLMAFFNNDPTTRQWFVDCAVTDPNVFALPLEILDLDVSKTALGELRLKWTSLTPYVGTGVVYDLVRGNIADLLVDRNYSRAGCASFGLTANPFVEPLEDPPPGEGWYYLIRGRDTCGSGTFGDSGLTVDPRDALDATACSSACGNGAIDGAEQCDGYNLAGQTCATKGYGGGTLSCNVDCTFETGNCTSTCGDGVAEVGEACDGADLAGQTCGSQGYSGGTLACSPFCELDTSACTLCGNGILEPGESCDGIDLGGETCESQGFTGGGTLGCTLGCGFDTSACTN